MQLYIINYELLGGQLGAAVVNLKQYCMHYYIVIISNHVVCNCEIPIFLL